MVRVCRQVETQVVTLVVISAFLLIAGVPKSPFQFDSVADRSGIKFELHNSATGEKHQVETMTGGVAIIDYDRDGMPDLFFVNGAQLPEMSKNDPRYWNRLFHNEGNGRFRDVTARAGVQGVGYSIGAAVADFDNDGYPDLYVTGVNANQLLHNNHDGTFTDATGRARVTGAGPGGVKPFSVAAGWFDYDNDGLLDLLVVNYIRWSLNSEPACKSGGIRAYCSPDSFEGEANTLFHNNGDGTFTDVSDASGISKVIGKGMGVAFADYDGDGFMDVFIANDTFRNLLFHNERNETFREVGAIAGVAYNENGKSIAGMGADFRDFDNDGRPDVFVTGTLHDTFPLFHNEGAAFADWTSESGLAPVTDRLTGWSNGIFDFDNDGWKDLFTANSAILDNSELIDHRPYRLPDLIMRNDGKGRFTPYFVSVPNAHRGAAFADLNGDGLMDIVVNNLNAPPEILLNRSNSTNHWLIVDLEGKRSNRDGIGAKVEISAGGRFFYNHNTTSVGYASSSDRRVHFGLGSAGVVDQLSITWPSGTKQQLIQVSVDRVLKVIEP